MSRLFQVFAWSFLIVAFVVAGAGIFLVFVSDRQWQQVMPISTMAFTSAGVFVALAGHLFSQHKNQTDRVEDRSQFYLESALKAYDQAQTLLADGNNDRATWIEAARCLKLAEQLSSEVTERSHKQVVELSQLGYRRFFAKCLQRKAAFFYGVKDHETASLDAAAAAHSAPEDDAGRHTTSIIRALSPNSLHAVWQAAQWPEGYVDPIDEGFTKKEQGKLLVLFHGLSEYLDHIETHDSASRVLFRRK